MSGRLDLAPPHSLLPFRGPETTIETMREQGRGGRGERSALLRSVTEEVVQGLQPKDYLSEIIAIRNWVASHVRYVNDPLTTEWTKDPQRLAEEILAKGVAAGDCDDIASLIAAMARQCGREAEFVTVGFGAPGQYAHVFCRVREPKSGRWIICDPVAGTTEGQMARRVATWKAWKID
jgi:transglutaminase-like putative cysteine protease